MDDYSYDEHDEYGQDEDDLAAFSDREAWEDEVADRAYDQAEDAHLEAQYEDRFGGE